MNEEFMKARELVELEQFKFYTNKMGLSASVFPVSDKNPVNVLIISLDNNINLNIMFIPIHYDQFTQISLMQLYAILQEKINVPNSNLFLLLNAINEKNPLGQFFIDDQGELAYKHVFTKVKTEFLSEIYFIELLSIIIPSITSHTIILREFILGKITIDSAIISLEL